MNDSLIVIVWLACGLIGLLLGMSKNRAGLGLAFGLVFGIIGWIIVGLSRPREDGEPDGLRGVFLVMLLLTAGGVILFGQHMRSTREADRAREEHARAVVLARQDAAEAAQDQAASAPPVITQSKPAAPVYTGRNPAPLATPRRLTAEEQNAEIARKYGTR